jgi:uncharacterized protein
MPVCHKSEFQTAAGLANPHFQTIWPALFRRAPRRGCVRKRLELPDGDFLDIDVYRSDSRRTAVITHGLDGSSDSAYVLGLAGALLDAGWSVWAWNFRGCSGEMNRLARSYHSGATEDLAEVLKAATASGLGPFAIVGFSLGANLTLKFAGEDRPESDKLIAAVGISCPADLGASADHLDGPKGALYRRFFIRRLRRHIARKERHLGGGPRWPAIPMARTFREFDDAYTAPEHGFADARDYWNTCMARRFIPGIRRPALILNADDDPMIPVDSLPYAETEASRWAWLEVTRGGGHVGFVAGAAGRLNYWAERRVVGFLNEAAA